MTAAFSDDEDLPRKKGRPRKVSTVTKQEYIDDGEEEADKEEAGFSGLFDESTLRMISRVRVIRKEPNEGTVGYLEDPALGESEIFERWGGSTYFLQALDMKGNIKKGATIKIAGDPVFVSKTAEMQWRRSRGLPPVEAPGAVAATAAPSFQEMMAMMQQQDERRRAEERDHAERLRKMEIEALADARKETALREERLAREKMEAEARARRDDEERDRRRAKDEEERESRRRREMLEAETRQQQFMQQTITMVQQSSAQALSFMRATAAAQPAGGNNLMDAVKTVVAIKEAFAGEGDGGEETPMNLLIKHGGEWINGLSSGIAGAVREIKNGGTAGQPGAAIPSQRLPSTNTGSSSPLALLPPNHPINEKVETLVAKLAAKGLDPLAAMSQIVDNVIKDVEKIPQQGQPQTAAPTSNGAPKPFTHDPASVAKVQPVAEVPVPVAAPKVIRRSFGS